MYDKILVPMALNHGISPMTLKTARVLCNPGGSITALHVYEVPQGSVAAYLGENKVQEGMQRAHAVLKEKTADMEDVTAEIARGHPYRTIIDYAVKNDVGCIVIGSHMPGLSDYLLGSTAARVVRHAPCAVHVHRDA
ncbi:universal stress protein [Primorskyibacter sedentarius]|uniref:Nucleotide-binding universal stress UspA family protein n=1 Tax=Primorskyibacter sedentarius TaxID=745311 RepID=A0A4R3JEP9_9RHOB|nr:universal stress protein [Primorskyibacter sedentarius]TCS64569.1 nucleotide-binding universal stress UspA family protein [Primorskyibacter sedentarius]